MGYCSAIKSNKVLRHVTTQMNLENMRPSERSHAQRTTYYDSTYMEYPEETNPQRQKADWLSGDGGRGELGGTGLTLGVMKMFWN